MLDQTHQIAVVPLKIDDLDGDDLVEGSAERPVDRRADPLPHHLEQLVILGADRVLLPLHRSLPSGDPCHIKPQKSIHVGIKQTPKNTRGSKARKGSREMGKDTDDNGSRFGRTGTED